MHRHLHLTVLLACALVSCARDDIVPGVSDSAFVATMAELRRVEGAIPDTVARIAERRRILQQRGLTADQLDRAGRALASDPGRAANLFDAIQKRAVNAVDGLPKPDSAGHAHPR